MREENVEYMGFEPTLFTHDAIPITTARAVADGPFYFAEDMPFGWTQDMLF